MRRTLPLAVALLGAALFAGAIEARAGAAPPRGCEDLSAHNIVNGVTQSPWWVCPVTPYFSQWETLGVGARAIGMAGAWGAIADEASGYFWNPAGTAAIQQYELTVLTGNMWVVNKEAGGPPNIGQASFFAPIHRPQVVVGLSYMRNLHTSPDFYFIPVSPAPPPTSLVIPYVRPLYLQEDAVVITFAAPFTFARSLSVGINAKYYWADRIMIKRTKVPSVTGIRGYAADVGFLWRTPLSQYGKEFAFGLSATDAAGEIRWSKGVQQDLAPVLRASFAYKIHLLKTEVTHATMDLDQVAEPGYGSDTSRKLRFGFEQWFFDNQFAVRAGYMTPFGYKGWWSLGATIRQGDFQGDFAYRSGDDKTPDHIPQSIYVQLTYRFGEKPTPNPPLISARAEPRLITPRNEESATFTLRCENETPVERWALSIQDKNERVVRTFSRPGQPPATVQWSGEDNRYQVLAEGEYVYTFKVRDMEGRTSITSPQRVWLTSPTASPDRDPTLLFKMVDGAQDTQDAAGKATSGDAKKALDERVKAATTPTPGPGWLWYGPAVSPWATATPTPPGTAGGTPIPRPAAFGSAQVPSANMLDAYVATNPEGSRTLAVDFLTPTNSVSFILQDVVRMARSLAGEAGSGVSNVDLRAHYGDNVLRVNATAESLSGLTAGRISPEQWLQTSFVTVNGQQITPSF